MATSGMLRRGALVRTDVSEELSAPTIRGTRTGELGTTLAVTSYRRRFLVTANVVPSSPVLVVLMMEAQVPLKRRFLQQPHGVTSQKTPFFVVTAVKTANLIYLFA
jgi:hypothetical protein